MPRRPARPWVRDDHGPRAARRQRVATTSRAACSMSRATCSGGSAPLSHEARLAEPHVDEDPGDELLPAEPPAGHPFRLAPSGRVGVGRPAGRARDRPVTASRMPPDALRDRRVGGEERPQRGRRSAVGLGLHARGAPGQEVDDAVLGVAPGSGVAGVEGAASAHQLGPQVEEQVVLGGEVAVQRAQRDVGLPRRPRACGRRRSRPRRPARRPPCGCGRAARPAPRPAAGRRRPRWPSPRRRRRRPWPRSRRRRCRSTCMHRSRRPPGRDTIGRLAAGRP